MLAPTPAMSLLAAEIRALASSNTRSSASPWLSVAARSTSLLIAMNNAAGTPLPDTSAIAKDSRVESSMNEIVKVPAHHPGRLDHGVDVKVGALGNADEAAAAKAPSGWRGRR